MKPASEWLNFEGKSSHVSVHIMVALSIVVLVVVLLLPHSTCNADATHLREVERRANSSDPGTWAT